VSMSTQGFRLSLALRHDDVDDVRTLESTSCMRLAEAAALIVAVSLDPVAVTEAVGVQAHSEPEPSDEPRVPETPPTPLPPPTARVSPPERVSPSPSTERADRPGLGLRADVGVGGGVLPSAGVGLSFTVSLL